MVLEKVKQLLAKQLEIPVEKIDPKSDIINDLGADSLDVAELLMTLEDEYSVTVPDEMANQLLTVEAIAEYISSVKKN